MARRKSSCTCPPSIENEHLVDCPHSKPATQRMISEECQALESMLLEKNRRYGDSALKPLRVLSQASAEEQLLVRIDDKLSRIAGGGEDDEDAILDLIGYLILLRISRRSAR